MCPAEDKPAMIDRLFQLSLLWMVGVSPVGAQVLTKVEFRLEPHSSAKTTVASCASAFV